MKRSESSTVPTPEASLLEDERRVAQLALLADRLRSPNGLDRDTLKRIEQLHGDE